MATERRLGRAGYRVTAAGAETKTYAEIYDLYVKNATPLNPGVGVEWIGPVSAEAPLITEPVGGERTVDPADHNAKYEMTRTDRSYRTTGTLLALSDGTKSIAEELYLGGASNGDGTWDEDTSDERPSFVFFVKNEKKGGGHFGRMFKKTEAWDNGAEVGDEDNARHAYPVAFEHFTPDDGDLPSKSFNSKWDSGVAGDFSPAATVTVLSGSASGKKVRTGNAGLTNGESYATVDGVNDITLKLIVTSSSYTLQMVDSTTTAADGTYNVVFHETGASDAYPGFPPGYAPPEEEEPPPPAEPVNAILSFRAGPDGVMTSENNIQNAGTQYSNAVNGAYAVATPELIGASGSGARFDLNFGSNGEILASSTVIDGGSGYPANTMIPLQVYRTGGPGNGITPENAEEPPTENDAYIEVATNPEDGSLQSASVMTPGSGYDGNAWAEIVPAINPSGQPDNPTEEAHGHIVLNGDGIGEFVLDNAGLGYPSTPEVVVHRTGGTNGYGPNHPEPVTVRAPKFDVVYAWGTDSSGYVVIGDGSEAGLEAPVLNAGDNSMGLVVGERWYVDYPYGFDATYAAYVDITAVDANGKFVSGTWGENVGMAGTRGYGAYLSTVNDHGVKVGEPSVTVALVKEISPDPEAASAQ